MVEQSAKALRDHETRDRANEMMQHFATWQVLAQSSLLNDFGRDPIEPGSAGTPPDSFNEHIFQPTRAAGN